MSAKPFARVHSDEQRAAVVYAVLDSGQPIGGKKCAQLAAEGKLPGPYAELPPFVITPRYVQELASRERQHRSGKGKTTLGQSPPKDAARKIMADCFDALDQEIRMCKRMKRGPARVAAIQGVAKATREVLALEQQLEPKPSAAPSNGKTAANRDRVKTPADDMAARIRSGTQSGRPEAAAEQTENGAG